MRKVALPAVDTTLFSVCHSLRVRTLAANTCACVPAQAPVRLCTNS